MNGQTALRLDIDTFASDDDCYQSAHSLSLQHPGEVVTIRAHGWKWAEFLDGGARWENVPFEPYNPTR